MQYRGPVQLIRMKLPLKTVALNSITFSSTMSRTLKTPSTPEEWEIVSRQECSSERLRLGLQALPAHERDSASKMRLSQFITLRTLWICHDGRSLVYGNHTECDGRSVPHSDWLDHNLVSDSRAWLSGWPPFQRYIGRLRDRQDPTRQDTSDPDVLSLVHVFQQDVSGLPGIGSRPDSPKYAIACRTRARVLASQAQHSSSPLAAKSRGRERTKTKVSSLFGRSAIEPVEELNIGLDQLQLESSLTPPPLALASPMSHSSPFTTGTFEAAADEEIVNHALVALLTGLTVYDHEITARWSGARLNLKISDLLNAKTDGFLRSARDSSALAILEVKARLRADRKTSIQFQESAQMAAWIYQCGSDGALKGAIIPGRQRCYCAEVVEQFVC